LFIVSLVSTYAGLYTINWILQNFLANSIVALIILFHPEIRRALAKVGEASFFQNHAPNKTLRPDITNVLFKGGESAFRSTITPSPVDLRSLEELIMACSKLSVSRIGALVIIERDTVLDDFIELGTVIDARISAEIFISIFHTGSPVHDGGLVIRKNKIYAAGCLLPLTTRTDLPSYMGTRHRAGIGLAEETDSVVVIVSEETGRITMVVGTRIEVGIDIPSLRALLFNILARPTVGRKQEEMPRTQNNQT
jgi:diadenylate cyclase